MAKEKKDNKEIKKEATMTLKEKRKAKKEKKANK